MTHVRKPNFVPRTQGSKIRFFPAQYPTCKFHVRAQEFGN